MSFRTKNADFGPGSGKNPEIDPKKLENIYYDTKQPLRDRCLYTVLPERLCCI